MFHVTNNAHVLFTCKWTRKSNLVWIKDCLLPKIHFKTKAFHELKIKWKI